MAANERETVGRAGAGARRATRERTAAGRVEAVLSSPPSLRHRWDLSPAEARAVQERLRRCVRRSPLAVSRLRRVAGCDVAVSGDRLCAVWVVLSLPGLALLDQAEAVVAASFPYVPGLLSFREIPPLLRAYEKLRVRPEAILCDGQGMAHPRRFGLACHLGVLLGLPSCGCAKSRLIGTHGEPGRARGAQSPLLDGEEVIGSVLRTRAGVKPLFVSPGHRMRLGDAVRLVLRCHAGFRLPEPTRRADREVGRLARALERGSGGATSASSGSKGSMGSAGARSSAAGS